MAATNVQTFSGDVEVASNLAVDTNTLLVDSVSNRIGIGTTIPQNTLAAVGNVTFGPGASTTDAAYHSGMLNVIGGNTRALLRIENDSSVGSPGIIFGEGGTFTEDTVPTIKKVQGTNDLAITTSGNIGIGRTDPEASLHLVGNAFVSANLEVGTANLFVDTVSGRVGIGVTEPGATLEVTGNAFVSANLEVGTANLFVDTVSGRVGIGITNPVTSGLHIANSYFATGGSTDHFDPQIFITGDSGTGGAQISAIGFSGNSNSDAHQRMVGGGIYYKGGGGTYGLAGYLGLAVADVPTSGDDQYGLTEGELVSHTRLAIVNNGNVGIGRTNPQAILDVAGGFTNSKSLQLRSGDSSDHSDSSQIIFSFANNSYNSGGYAHSIRTRHNSGADTGNAIDFWLWNTTDTADEDTLGNKRVMTLEGSGAVGIGTTNPSSNLHVVGNVEISSNLAVDTNTLFVDSVNNRVGIGVTVPTLAKLHVSVNDTSVAQIAMTNLNQNGRTGLNMVNAANQAFTIQHVGGPSTSSNAAVIENYSQLNGGIEFYNKGDGVYKFHTTDSNNERVRITNDGKVGIGTTNPLINLDVSGAGGVGHRSSGAEWDHIYITTDGSNGFLLAGGCAALYLGVANENTAADSYGNQGYNGVLINDGATSVSAWSDVRMKTKIEALSDVIASIAKLDTIKYNLKSDFAHKKKLIGVVAQNIEKYFPDLVTVSKDGEISVDYGELPVILLRAIQELQSDINRNNRAIIEDTSEDITGLLVSKNNDKYINTYNKIVSVPRVSLSNVYNDKRCIGVVSDIEKPDDRDKHYEEFDKISEKDINDTLVFIHSTGSGKIWVTDMNGNLEIGDYLTTSNISGYGTKQSDDILHSYTVAKISVDCDFLESFNNVEQPIKVTRDVDLWVKDNWVPSTEEEHCRLNECECRVMKETYYTDGTSNICVDEYSNLESNVQSTYTEQSRQVYIRQRSIETTIDPGNPAYKMTKIERAFNAIDEDGKLVWEVADEKQSSYQLRYLDEIGNLTDKANAVYRAALVDCNFTST